MGALRETVNVAESIRMIDVDGGGVTAAHGFKAAGVHAGLRPQADRLDCALVVAERPCTCAALFTQNAFCAAPVAVSRSQLYGLSFGIARGVLINSGNANAATGQAGIDVAHRCARTVAEHLACQENEVLLASTGTIGVHLPFEPFETGIPQACAAMSRDGGHDAARAIMTTDTCAKEYAVAYRSEDPDYGGRTFTVGGMAKGSGMIMPNVATMIAVITTDAPLAPNAAHRALADAANVSFNKVTVDSDTSTNDSCFLLASGCAAPADEGFRPIREGSLAFAEFSAALQTVCIRMARMIAADGEGATKLVTVRVSHAFDDADADRVARTVATSPLVKTAIFGHDANWGRIAASLGHSGAIFRREDVVIAIMGVPVCRCGVAEPFDEAEALRRFAEPEICIDIDLGAGDAETTVWTCDLSPEYVSINGSYRS